ncbi:MAG: hypothetical protein COA43_09860 [Robiginitomaculum sp.]|nr:MAG: hypothetical protein COA43_09860 [Robiginitomaculum sp.]
MATAMSLWFGFKDDVPVRARAARGGGSRVDIRSVSNEGVKEVSSALSGLICHHLSHALSLACE